MDLLKVKVENFRCFQGPHEVDMTEGPLWVVRGENGSGKSTLICDSILFALFNTIPSLEGTQSLKKTDLINLKSKSMNVQIWFNHNGNRYSIRRSYWLKGKTDTLHHQFEAWENNKEIMDTPRMEDARTFVSKRFWEIEDFRNTTIILQKEITNSLDQRESERKKSIEKIFNIERFAKMSELAHRHARDTQTEIKIISNSLDEIKKQIVNEEELQEKRFNAQESVKITTNNKIKIETNLKKNKEIKESLDKEVLKGENLKEKIKQKNSDLQKNEQEKQKHIDELAKIESDLAKEPQLVQKLQEIVKIEGFLENANKTAEVLKSKEKEISSVNTIILNKQKTIQNELQQLTNNKELLDSQLDTTRKELKSLQEREAIIPKLSEHAKRIPQLTKEKENLRKELDNANVQTNVLYSKEKDLELQKKRTDEQLSELRKKQNQLGDLEGDKKNNDDAIAHNKIRGKQLEEETENLDELKQKEQELNNSLFKIDHELKSCSKAIQEIQIETAEIKSLDTQGICPKCKQKLNEKHINDITQENNKKINDLEQKIKIANETKKEFQNALITITKDVNSKNKIKKELDDVKKDYIANKSKLESIVKQITMLTEEMKSLQQIKLSYDSNDLFANLEAEISLLKKQIPDTGKLKDDYNTVDKKLLEASKSETQLLELQNQLKTKPEKEKLASSITSNINEATKQIELKKELLESKRFAIEENKNLEELQKQLVAIKKELPDIEKTKKDLDSLEPELTRNTLKSLDRQKGVKDEKTERLKSIDVTLKSIKKDIQDYEYDLSQLGLEKIIPDVEKYAKEIETLDNELAEATKTLFKLEYELQSIAEQMAKNNQYMNDYKAKNKEYETLKNKKDDYDLLEELFKDIGKRILNRVMSRINIYSTEILSRLGNEQLEQITLVESKNGFELKILSAGEERYPNWFSGGQKVRIGLAFRLSLSKTLAEVTGGDIETILIDEGDFGALDDYGLKGVADILNDLKNFFKRMVIVTHMEHLANELDGRRLLIKDSKIELEKM